MGVLSDDSRDRLAHLPSGQFNANAAWLLAATLAHNLLRWTASWPWAHSFQMALRCIPHPT